MNRLGTLLAASAALLSACSAVQASPRAAAEPTPDEAPITSAVVADLQAAMTSVRFFELRHGGDLPASAAELEAEGFRPSEGTTVSVVGDGEVLCLSLWNPASVKASREGRTFRWDSVTRTIIEPGELGSGACVGLM